MVSVQWVHAKCWYTHEYRIIMVQWFYTLQFLIFLSLFCFLASSSGKPWVTLWFVYVAFRLSLICTYIAVRWGNFCLSIPAIISISIFTNHKHESPFHLLFLFLFLHVACHIKCCCYGLPSLKCSHLRFVCFIHIFFWERPRVAFMPFIYFLYPSMPDDFWIGVLTAHTYL